RLGELAGEFAGMPLTQARSAIVKALDEAGLLVSSEPVRQVVGVHERCQTPVEFQIRPQWFIAVREHADRFRARAAELEWVPPVNDGWGLGGTDPALAPMSMRVQAFEIIRTWLFYSVVQSELLFGRVPWRTALISGWGLSEQGKKLSKRNLDSSTGPDGYNRYVPDDVMGKYGADAGRACATRGRNGTNPRHN